jgi:hypothetical protein
MYDAVQSLAAAVLEFVYIYILYMGVLQLCVLCICVSSRERETHARATQ